MELFDTTKRTLDSKFKFRCHKDLECFNKCCGQILLTPYDVLRIKNRLGITSGEFLSKYTTTYIDKSSSLPYAIIKKCPFVTPEGCSIYEDRPTSCRYYPVAQATGVVGKENVKGIEEFYFFIKDPECLGHKEDKEWTIREWKIDQGLEIYDEMNKEWRKIQLCKRDEIDSKMQSLIYMVSYDIDSFRKFVMESKFLDIFDLDDELIEQIKNDDVALMKLGFDYLKYVLKLEDTLKLKGEIESES